jgi:hypothetical protein
MHPKVNTIFKHELNSKALTFPVTKQHLESSKSDKNTVEENAKIQ